MAEQLKLFEDILPLNGTKEKRELTEKKNMESWVKSTSKLNEQQQASKVQKMYAEQDPETQKLMKTAIQHSSIKHPPLRKETDSERTERYLWLYDEGEKPAHYDDPLIEKVDTFQGFAKAMPLKKENNIIKKKMPTPPRQFNSMDKRTYPSNPKVKANLSTWDLMIATAKTPKEKGEIRRVLRDEFVRNGIKNLSDSEQKMIGRGKYETYPKISVPTVDMNMIQEPQPKTPDVPVEEIIRVEAQKRLEREQDEFEKKNGSGGIIDLMRPV